MPEPRVIAVFFLKLMLLYGILVVPWPGARSAYRAIFICGANVFAQSLVSGTSVNFKPAPDVSNKKDTHAVITIRSNLRRVTIRLSSQNPAYLMMAFFTSLALATPQPRKRLFGSLALGLLLVYVTVLFWLSILIAYEKLRIDFESPTHVPSTTWDLIVVVARGCVADEVVMMLLVPVMIWILVCFRISHVADEASPGVKMG